MKIGIGLSTQIRNMDAAVIPRWASRAQDAVHRLAGFTAGERARRNRRDVRRTTDTAAWRDAGREGSPRLVAIASFVFGDVQRGRSNVRDYYAATGDEFANTMAQSVHVGADEARAVVESFEAIEADELILHPTIVDTDEVGKLADAVLR